MKFKILRIGVGLGEKKVDNNGYIDHFKDQGKDIDHFLKDIMGRDMRVESEKTSLDLAILATKDALSKNNLDPKEIDMIIYSANLAEYIVPPSSIVLHHTIGARPDCFCFDMNINCAGMLGALRIASNHLASNKHFNKVLIVGSDNLRNIADPNNEVCYGTHGDAACAVIVEKTESDSEILGFNSVIDSGGCYQAVRFPEKGMSHLLKGLKDQEDVNPYVSWKPFDGAYPIPFAAKQINELLESNNCSIEDIKAFCFSQFSIHNIRKLEKALNIDASKRIYIGDRYGYTGTNSPFLAMNEAIEEGRVKRGDLVLVWTLGIGFESIATLIRY